MGNWRERKGQIGEGSSYRFSKHVEKSTESVQFGSILRFSSPEKSPFVGDKKRVWIKLSAVEWERKIRHGHTRSKSIEKHSAHTLTQYPPQNESMKGCEILPDLPHHLTFVISS